MNQIPNIEETHNTREEIEKVILDWIEEEKKDNYAYGDIKTSYTLDGYFDLSNLVDALHQQLQKAREQAVQEFKRKATKSFIMYINDAEPGFNDPQSSYIENSFFSALDHSELDQPSVCAICHGHGNNGADDAPCLNCGGSGEDHLPDRPLNNERE